jgi:hypothetical protein
MISSGQKDEGVKADPQNCSLWGEPR